MFKITLSKGFQMTFDNGWTVSVQFGAGNYCQKQYDRSQSEIPTFTGDREIHISRDAEIAAWDENGNWYWFDELQDSVKGYVTTNEVVKFINMIAQKEAWNETL